MTLVLGIDDAGRGPIIGPMMLAGVLMTREQEQLVKEEGAKDSKQLLHSARVRIAQAIKQHSIASKVIATPADEIDSMLQSGVNLNTLEAMKTAYIINELTNGRSEEIRVIVDCPSVNTKAWKVTLLSYIQSSATLDISCEHKADVNHACVSAGSILAKVAREEAVAQLKQQFKEYGDLGSGYPSDPATKEFLKKNGLLLKDAGIFRKTWSTWKVLYPESGQSTLGSFSK